jgi:hypothetical protein
MTFYQTRIGILRIGAFAICLTALTSSTLLAQGDPGAGRRGPGSAEAQQARLDSMTKAVGLTDDQAVRIKAINADSMTQMRALRKTGGDPQDMYPRMMEIRQAENVSIQTLLTEEQKPRYAEWIKTQPRPGRMRQDPPPASPQL